MHLLLSTTKDKRSHCYALERQIHGLIKKNPILSTVIHNSKGSHQSHILLEKQRVGSPHKGSKSETSLQNIWLRKLKGLISKKPKLLHEIKIPLL